APTRHAEHAAAGLPGAAAVGIEIATADGADRPPAHVGRTRRYGAERAEAHHTTGPIILLLHDGAPSLAIDSDELTAVSLPPARQSGATAGPPGEARAAGPAFVVAREGFLAVLRCGFGRAAGSEDEGDDEASHAAINGKSDARRLHRDVATIATRSVARC